MKKASAAPASLGMAMIAYNAEATLGPCLASFKPYVKQLVVCVDERTTDKTAQIARRHGAEVHSVKVSDWHECADHGKILIQHFADARNESFKYLDPDLDFWGWADADDVIEGAELLPVLLSRTDIPENLLGWWSEYIYGYVLKPDGTRVTNTTFFRERILRTKMHGKPIDWVWKHRVHETVGPAQPIPGAQWGLENRIRWVHQHQAHKSEMSSPRNLTLLEVDYEERPDEPRTVFYMGNTYFAVGNWPAAAEWYERYTMVDGEKNPYELWQSYVYMSHAYERLGDMDNSLKAAFGAIDALPNHPEPYYALAGVYAATGEPDKAIHWTQVGDACEEAPFFAFRNPMDRGFNKYLPLAQAYMDKGQLTKAKECWQQAASHFPDEEIKHRAEWAQAKEMAEKAASSFVDMATMLPEETVLDMYQQLPGPVKEFGRTRNIAMSVLRNRRKGLSQPKIVFWCGRSMEPWAPPVLTTTGIGGSETAVIEIAKRFAAAGWLVDVYNGADHMEGVYDGVGYWDPERLPQGEECDVFVSWRAPQAWQLPIKAKQKVLWCHDLNYGPDAAEHFHRDKWDVVLGVSAWHADMLFRYYGIGQPLGRALPDFVPNGIDLSRFKMADDFHKVPFQCVYASSPDRGLQKLLDLWPQILKAEPQATLHVGYGWENFDKMADTRPDMRGFKESVMKRIDSEPSITFRGRLPQDELARLYCESYAWLYPTDFLEVSCISAMEAMAGGAVPVTTACGALPETVGTAGLLVPGPQQTRAYADAWPKVALGVLMDSQLRLTYAAKGIDRAKQFTWDAAFQRWLTVLGLDMPAQEPPAIPEREMVAA